MRHRAGWLPDQEGLERWLRRHRERAGAHGTDGGGTQLHNAVRALPDLAAALGRPGAGMAPQQPKRRKVPA